MRILLQPRGVPGRQPDEWNNKGWIRASAGATQHLTWIRQSEKPLMSANQTMLIHPVPPVHPVLRFRVRQDGQDGLDTYDGVRGSALNAARRHSSLGYLSPVAFEKQPTKNDIKAA